MTGSLLIRRLRPVAAAATAAAGLAFQTVIGDAPAVAGFAALLIVTYSVAQYADRRRDALLGLLLIVAAVELYPFVTEDVSVADEIANAAIPILVWVFARLARERLDRAVRAERDGDGGPRAGAGGGAGPRRRRWPPSAGGSPARCTTSSGTG